MDFNLQKVTIMKAVERNPLLANVLTAVWKHTSAEVGKQVKAVVTYMADGTRTDLDVLRLQAYYDLLLQDIDSMRIALQLMVKKGDAVQITEKYSAKSLNINKKMYLCAGIVFDNISRDQDEMYC